MVNKCQLPLPGERGFQQKEGDQKTDFMYLVIWPRVNKAQLMCASVSSSGKWEWGQPLLTLANYDNLIRLDMWNHCKTTNMWIFKILGSAVLTLYKMSV